MGHQSLGRWRSVARIVLTLHGLAEVDRLGPFGSRQQDFFPVFLGFIGFYGLYFRAACFSIIAFSGFSPLKNGRMNFRCWHILQGGERPYGKSRC